MANNYRVCAGVQHFNTGASKCAVDPDKIKGVIFVMHGYLLPDTLTANALKEACHADRPERLLPIKNIVEYAVSGGDAQVSAVGYGPNRITGYAARTDTFTLAEMDLALRANLAQAKNVALDMFPYDANNVIYGVKGDDGKLHGIELSGVYPGGQDWDASGTEANLTVNVMIKDVEKYMKTADVIVADFDIDEALEGLVYVDVVSSGASGSFKIVEHYGGLDVTPYYGKKIVEKASSVLEGASTATYDDANQAIKATGLTGLKAPSVLFANGVIGIEHFK